jgi:hypothetical protein
VADDLAQLAARRDELDIARLWRHTDGEVDVRAVGMGITAGVHHDLVRDPRSA